MRHVSIRVITALVAGAVIGGALVAAAFALAPGLVLEMDRGPLPFLSGVYAPERAGDVTFAWTSGRATLRLPELDRRHAWTCTIRMRAARPPALPVPRVSIEADAVALSSAPAPADYDDVRVQIPPANRSGLTLGLVVDPTFVPGGGDPRALGVQVDRWACAPASGHVWPPHQALHDGMFGAGLVGAAVALAGGSIVGALVAAAVTGLGTAVLLAAGGGAFAPYASILPWVLLAAACAIVLGRLSPRERAEPLGAATLATFVIASLGCALKLLALLHPAKTLVDALFQAHRLDWVMTGRYFFTQPMPDGVAFPYAIALYVVAAPFTIAVADHVALLRGVVSVAEAASAVVLAFAIVRVWRDRAAGAIAVLFLFLAPLPYVVVGNGNLTNAFGQSMAAIVLGIIASGAAASGIVAGLALTVCMTVAFLSHVSTIAVLAPTLAAVAAAFWLLGRGRLRRDAVAVVLMTLVALVAAVALYYRHFPEVYRDAIVRVHGAAGSPAPAPVLAPPAAADARAAALVRQLSWTERTTDALTQAVDAVGWPMLLLAIAGAIRTSRDEWRDRLTLVLLASAAVWCALCLAGALLHVGTQYQRYASEFMGRIDLATYPVVAILAARAVSWPWAREGRAALAGRAAVLLLTAGVVVVGTRAWLSWLQ